MKSNALFQAALDLHKRSRSSEAKATCRKILERDPRHAGALHLSGLIAVGTRDLRAAVAFLEKASILDENPAFLTSLGNAYRLSGRRTDASRVLSRALELQPTAADTLVTLGFVELETGELEKAVARFERAVTLTPSAALVQRSLGTAYFALKRLDKAEQHLRVAIALDPKSFEAELDLVQVLLARYKWAAALEPLRRAVQRSPKSASLHRDLSAVLCELGHLDESLATVEHALQLDPRLVVGHFARGRVLMMLGQASASIESYRRVIELERTNSVGHSTLIYMLALHPELDDTAVLEEARRWESAHVGWVPRFEHAPSSERERPLRIGYVSADFRQHVIGYFVLPLLEQHDRQGFETFCYSTFEIQDSITELYRAQVSQFRDISAISDEQAAAQIRDDRIDILVDLTMHTAGTRLQLFGRRPAPIQVSWLAYMGTTGLSAIDYRLTDPHVDPPELGFPASEVSWRLPDTLWCFRPSLDGSSISLEPGLLPALSNGFITFGAFPAFSRINDQVLSVWAQVLAAVRDSRLIMHVPEGSPRERVRRLFEQHGVSVDRLELLRALPREEYLKTYQRVDIALDTQPYSGGTTSLEAWWMGVPVLSQAGRRIAGRSGVCFTQNLGLPEWLAPDADGFVAAAQRLSADLPSLANLRAELRERIEHSPLMDTVRFARNIEQAYREMWRCWCDRAVG